MLDAIARFDIQRSDMLYYAACKKKGDPCAIPPNPEGIGFPRAFPMKNEGTEGEPLVFEAWTDHNGYYLHSFSFGKRDNNEKEKN